MIQLEFQIKKEILRKFKRNPNPLRKINLLLLNRIKMKWWMKMIQTTRGNRDFSKNKRVKSP